MRANSPLAGSATRDRLGGTQPARRTIKHAVHEAMALTGAETARERNCLIDYDTERHVDALLQLPDRKPQDGALDRIHFLRRTICEGCDIGVELRRPPQHRENSVSEEGLVRFLKLVVCPKLRHQLYRRQRVDLRLIKRLDRRVSRSLARARGRRFHLFSTVSVVGRFSHDGFKSDAA